MADLTAAQKARAEKRLNTLFRYSEGVMSERQFIELAFSRGWACVSERWQREGRKVNGERKIIEKEGYNVVSPDKTSVEVSKAAFDYFHYLVADREAHDLYLYHSQQ